METSSTQKIWISPAPLAGKTCYKIEYSEFPGVVFVRFEDDKVSSVEFASRSEHSTSAEDLRRFPMMAIETLIRNGGHFVPNPNRPDLSKPSGRIDKDFLFSIRNFYLDALTRNERPLKSIADHLRVPHSTVARWVLRARSEGILK